MVGTCWLNGYVTEKKGLTSFRNARKGIKSVTALVNFVFIAYSSHTRVCCSGGGGHGGVPPYPMIFFFETPLHQKQYSPWGAPPT